MLYQGIVVNRHDPLKLGRCQVRVVGVHTHDRSLLKNDDLPWAIPSQPITSAAISGIGFSPTGVVEGTWVLIGFADEPSNQEPIMLGTLAGIPQADGVVDQDVYDGVAIVDEDGNLPENLSIPTPSSTIIGKLAKDWTPSNDCINLIKKTERLKLTAYKDASAYSIGYGLRKIDGIPVYQGQTITNEKAESSFRDYVNRIAVPDVVSGIKTLITQGMFDALVSFAYNLGGPKARKSTVFKETNLSNYTQAAAEFSSYVKDELGNTLQALQTRRDNEKSLYLKQGIPGSSVPPPTFLGQSQLNTESTTNGFSDPNGIYPKYKFEPDTNRLARNERIETTTVRKKELEREMGIVTSGGFSWNQSYVPYNTTYPFNKVFESESGHIMEFDDSPNSERINLYHKKGTFFEIDANGTRVTKIVGDNYEIQERNGFLYIKGDSNITIDGMSRVKINNALSIEVSGAATINVYNDANIAVSGNMTTSVAGSYKLKADSISFESANNIDMTAATINETANTVNLRTSTYNETVTGTSSYRWEGDKHFFTGADTYERHNIGTDYSNPSDPSRSSNISGSSVNSAGTATLTNLPQPAIAVVPVEPQFNTLHVESRAVTAGYQYDAPEDGDPAPYVARQIDKGTIDTTPDISVPTIIIPQTKPTPIHIPKPVTHDLIMATETFHDNYQLSKNINMSAVTLNGKHKIVAQQGLTVQQIVSNLKGLSENCLDIVYDMYPNATLSSGFRPYGYPKESSKKSQHYLGQAADIHLKGFNKQQHHDAVIALEKVLPYDQLILEYLGATGNWIHVSFSFDKPRKQIFTLKNHKTFNRGNFVLIA